MLSIIDATKLKHRLLEQFIRDLNELFITQEYFLIINLTLNYNKIQVSYRIIKLINMKLIIYDKRNNIILLRFQNQLIVKIKMIRSYSSASKQLNLPTNNYTSYVIKLNKGIELSTRSKKLSKQIKLGKKDIKTLEKFNKYQIILDISNSQLNNEELIDILNFQNIIQIDLRGNLFTIIPWKILKLVQLRWIAFQWFKYIQVDLNGNQIIQKDNIGKFKQMMQSLQRYKQNQEGVTFTQLLQKQKRRNKIQYLSILRNAIQKKQKSVIISLNNINLLNPIKSLRKIKLKSKNIQKPKLDITGLELDNSFINQLELKFKQNDILSIYYLINNCLQSGLTQKLMACSSILGMALKYKNLTLLDYFMDLGICPLYRTQYLRLPRFIVSQKNVYYKLLHKYQKKYIENILQKQVIESELKIPEERGADLYIQNIPFQKNYKKINEIQNKGQCIDEYIKENLYLTFQTNAQSCLCNSSKIQSTITNDNTKLNFLIYELFNQI